jgi:RND family efflux transporter MFP subunit
MSQPDRDTEPSLLRRLRRIAGAFAVLAIAVVAYGLVSRALGTSRLQRLTEAEAVPAVAIVAPTQVENHAGLDLPGRLEAYIRAPIYARVPGYLMSWKYDIGAKVKAGDVLAEIDTPDLDQQLVQARASLRVAEANAKLAQITAERWQSLASTDAVAQQDVDTRTFTWNADMAQVKAAQANVDQLVAEEGFKRLSAPFDGIITARNTDIGDLINVGAAGGTQLFVVSETTKLRIYVNVPQNYVPRVPPGTRATINVPEHPGRTYNGTVEASAQAVIPSTGGLREHPSANRRK